MDSSPTSDPPLIRGARLIRRGVACASCRKKKVACDTSKPACGTCIRMGIDSECDYPGSKRTQRLPYYEQRLRCLQVQVDAAEASNARRKRLMDKQEEWFWGVWDFSSPYFQTTRLRNATVDGSLEPRNRIPYSVDWHLTNGEPSTEICNFLLLVAQKHAFDFSAEFDTPSRIPSIDPNANSHLAVLNALCLLGCYYNPGSLNSLEPLFLRRAQRYLAKALADNPLPLVDILKASAMLAYYSFFRVRLVEAYNTTSTVITFAKNNGLYDLWPEKYRPSGVRRIFRLSDSNLGEYIDVWWQNFSLDRGARTFCEQPMLIPDEMIRTPWPQSREERARGEFSYIDNTVLSLYSSRSSASSASGNSPLALRAKCLALYERATRVSTKSSTQAHSISYNAHAFIRRLIFFL
ncbi:hypothetical protein BOTBODRAFT_568128 [Botryobasidium botryosum FD-172 SS1]|uniref:Zn(2)-C6 fungal-type domain-containing protein n=1 Tax=Botryobasidium botryosum (strain FD-172 SS1) TaxID=930990 RepID=A0A067LYV2_BOTB1|nr:hypothetical protein BOTBODRAFT_568128 [Botryobasidium botryosum FD-172 SS1]